MPAKKQRDPEVLARLSNFHLSESERNIELWYDQYESAYRSRERSAPKKGTRFQLSKREFWGMVYRARGCCEITGQPFDRFHKGPTGKRPFLPTIDRISSVGHYTTENCELLTWISNVAISDFGRHAFLEMVKYGAISSSLQKHIEEEERKQGISGTLDRFDNILPYIRDHAVGRWIARHLLSIKSEDE